MTSASGWLGPNLYILSMVKQGGETARNTDGVNNCNDHEDVTGRTYYILIGLLCLVHIYTNDCTRADVTLLVLSYTWH